jgi:hypothetical protein
VPPDEPGRRTTRATSCLRLARYAARNANFVLVAATHNGLGAPERRQETQELAKSAAHGISRAGPLASSVPWGAPNVDGSLETVQAWGCACVHADGIGSQIALPGHLHPRAGAPPSQDDAVEQADSLHPV